MTNQVPVVGILMIVNGSLTCVLAVGAFVVTAITSLERHRHRQEEAILIVFLGFGGVLLLCAGLLNIFGGIRALKYRNRAFVLTCLFFNLVPTLTIYCTANSLGLLIYGLIVIFNSDVARAFTLGETGMQADEIRARMDPYWHWRRPTQDFRDRTEHEERYRLPPPRPPAEPGDTGIYPSS